MIKDAEHMTDLSKEKGINIYLYPHYKPNDIELSGSKRLMVIGQTGSGKTTLLDAMLNYLCGV